MGAEAPVLQSAICWWRSGFKKPTLNAPKLLHVMPEAHNILGGGHGPFFLRYGLVKHSGPRLLSCDGFVLTTCLLLKFHTKFVWVTPLAQRTFHNELSIILAVCS